MTENARYVSYAFVPDSRSVRNTGSSLVATIFALLFVGVGLLLIGTAIRYFLRLFNPQVEVTLGTPLRLGETSQQ